MSSLEAVGKLSTVKTFNNSLNYDAFQIIDLENESEYNMAIDTRNMALKNDKQQLVLCLNNQIQRYEMKKM